MRTSRRVTPRRGAGPRRLVRSPVPAHGELDPLGRELVPFETAERGLRRPGAQRELALREAVGATTVLHLDRDFDAIAGHTALRLA